MKNSGNKCWDMHLKRIGGIIEAADGLGGIGRVKLKNMHNYLCIHEEDKEALSG
jgi:hypothetical protein